MWKKKKKGEQKTVRIQKIIIWTDENAFFNNLIFVSETSETSIVPKTNRSSNSPMQDDPPIVIKMETGLKISTQWSAFISILERWLSYSETLNNEYMERIHQMSYSSLSDNGMLQMFSFLIKWLYGTLYNCSRIFMAINLFSQILKFT